MCFSPGKDGTEEDRKWLDLPEESNEPETFYLDHENETAWRVFLACATQWRLLPMGGVQGIDYTALQSVLIIYSVENTKETFNKVRLIEQGALAQIAEQAALNKAQKP